MSSLALALRILRHLSDDLEAVLLIEPRRLKRVRIEGKLVATEASGLCLRRGQQPTTQPATPHVCADPELFDPTGPAPGPAVAISRREHWTAGPQRLMIEGMGRAELRRRVAGTVVVVGAAAATLAGCGGTSNAPFVARLCASARSSADLTLVLSNVLPPPEAQATRGDQVEVVSGYHGNQMSLPVAHPAGAVCEVSQGHAAHGDAVVVYKVLRPALIRFVSGLAHPTGAADPAMVGRLVVSR